MKILIFGANGQLGTDLSAKLRQAGHLVEGLTHSGFDVTDTLSVNMVLQESPTDVVINCTAFHNSNECEKDPYQALRVNAIAPMIMANWCKSKGRPFTHFSTDYVFNGFGEYGAIPYEEKGDYPAPLQAYGKSKYIGEQSIQLVNPDATIIRTASLYGKAGSSGKGGNFVETILRKLKAGEIIEVVNDVIMSPTSTVDLSDAVVSLLQHNPSGIYHIVNSGECSWYEFACAIREISGIEGNIVPCTLLSRNESFSRPRYSALACNRLNSCGIVMRPWKEALEEYIKS